MIPPMKKIQVFLLTVMLSLSLCNIPAVFATGSVPIAAAALQSGSVSEQKPSENGGAQEEPDDALLLTNSIMLENDIVWKEVANIDELLSLLEDTDWINTGEQIRVIDDLVIPADSVCMLWLRKPQDAPLVVDFGAHTLYVEGWLRSFGNIKYIGDGGKNGLIHIKEDGKANIRSAVFAVTQEGGYAIWQENGSILSYEPVDGSVGDIRFAQPLAGEASTFAELMLLLEDDSWKANGGQITVTDDLVVPAGEEHKIGWLHSKALTTLDMGGHTLFVEGMLGVYEKVELIGTGGENGLLRVCTGGEVVVQSAALIAEQDSYAIWQEEGSLLDYSPNENTVGKVHFAEKPVAVPFSMISPDTDLPVVMVYDGQMLEDLLPVTDSVQLYWQGIMDQGTNNTDKRIPVAWDLESYQSQLDEKKRVLITGSYPDAVAFGQPVCLVVFQNGKPATFLNSYGAETYGMPGGIGDIWLENPELGCRFEWSQDGEIWFPAQFEAIPNGDGSLHFKVTFSLETPPEYPYYLSAVVDYPDGSVGYSDIIAFTGAEKACGSGGNRGGGTDITEPPNVLTPNPPDNSGIGGDSGQKPESPDNSDSDESENPEPDAVPAPTPEQSAKPDVISNPTPKPPDQADTMLPSTIEPSDQADTPSPQEEPEESVVALESNPNILPVEVISVIGQTTPLTKAESDLQVSSQIVSETEAGESNTILVDTADGISDPIGPALANPAGKAAIAETALPQSDNEGSNPPAKAISIVVGGTATIMVIGAAGVYHSESLRKRLRAAWKKMIRRKK